MVSVFDSRIGQRIKFTLYIPDSSNFYRIIGIVYHKDK